MTPAQRNVTLGFSIPIGLAMAWGLCTYEYYWYQDLRAPVGSIAEAAFLYGRTPFLLASIVSVLLGICFRICYTRLGKPFADPEPMSTQRPVNRLWVWARAALAALLVMLLVALFLPGTRRLVIDYSTNPPTYRVFWVVGDCLWALGIALIGLACVYVGMCKGRIIERVGWAILISFLVLSIMLG